MMDTTLFAYLSGLLTGVGLGAALVFCWVMRVIRKGAPVVKEEA